MTLLDPSNLSAFGTLETAELTPVVQVDFIHGLNTQIGAGTTANSATVDTSAGRLRLQSGTIVCIRPDEQMGRVAARRVIALVTNDTPWRDIMPRKQKRGMVYANLFVINHDLPIPVRVERTSPRPASIRPPAFIDLRPEAIGVRHLDKTSPKMAFHKTLLGLSATTALTISSRYIHARSITRAGHIREDI